MKIPKEIIDLAKVLGPEVLAELIKYFGKTHGSKVKEGSYKDCTIELDGDKAKGRASYRGSPFSMPIKNGNCPEIKNHKKRR